MKIRIVFIVIEPSVVDGVGQWEILMFNCVGKWAPEKQAWKQHVSFRHQQPLTLLCVETNNPYMGYIKDGTEKTLC